MEFGYGYFCLEVENGVVQDPVQIWNLLIKKQKPYRDSHRQPTVIKPPDRRATGQQSNFCPTISLRVAHTQQPYFGLYVPFPCHGKAQC